MDTSQKIQMLMQARNFDQAFEEARKMASDGQDPRHIEGDRNRETHTKTLQYVEGLYLQAVCARFLKKYELAREILDSLCRVAPDFGRGLQEEGHLARDEGDLFTKQGGKGLKAPDPIFILGLPRAGSTLLEQIIASHSQVDGALELPNVLSMSFQLRGRGPKSEGGRYPEVLHDLSVEKLKQLGERYIADTQIHRKDAPFFIDKMPNNFRHIGLINLILPNAKIIDARRHPMACCFSGFKQHFAEGQEFTYGLKNVGTYYKDYVALMDHWDKVLPGKILRVQYEEVVKDTEAQVHRILEYLGLPFEEACLEFHKTKRSVRTASSEQVRQPIFKSGLEQWRHFEPWLTSLKEALGSEILARYPIEPS